MPTSYFSMSTRVVDVSISLAACVAFKWLALAGFASPHLDFHHICLGDDFVFVAFAHLRKIITKSVTFIQVAVVLEADIVLVAIQVGELTASMLASQEHVSANESHWLSELLYWVIYSPLEMLYNPEKTS